MTPIDWKPQRYTIDEASAHCHHSLVTPIDWKPASRAAACVALTGSHHSLVTPIDWKLLADGVRSVDANRVTTRW